LSTTNPICCPDTNPGRRGGKPATNRLSYGTAKKALSYSAKSFSVLLTRKKRLKLYMHSHIYDLVSYIPTDKGLPHSLKNNFHKNRQSCSNYDRSRVLYNAGILVAQQGTNIHMHCRENLKPHDLTLDENRTRQEETHRQSFIKQWGVPTLNTDPKLGL
jgi:hypothetical protein